MSMSAGFPAGEELPERIGHYAIRRRIGQGGMGVVYQAEDPGTHQFVAVKVLKPEVAGDHIARARLAREVETMRRVQSPNVAEVIDADTQAELPWVATEYIPGPTLDSTVSDHGPLRGRALTRFVTGLARAIKDIHEVEVIHRDLKPGNVIISNGEPIVIDFGIAHAVDGAKLTQTGTFVGTPSYLSPEVIEGTDLGPATDVHAWGGTVAFASTGRPPYGEGSFEVIFFRILNGEIDNEGMHEALQPLVAAAVARDMQRRPTAAQLVAETGRLNLDLPWTEDVGAKSTGLTGNYTVQGQTSGPAPADSDSGGRGAAGAAGAAAAGAAFGGAAGYLASRAGTEGWGPSHTTSGPNPTSTASAWGAPSASPRTQGGRSSGWGAGDEATDDLHSGAPSGWGTGDEATDDLGGTAAGTERITPDGSADLHEPQGTQRIQPGPGDDPAAMQGTQRIQPGAPAEEEPQGTMMMRPDQTAERSRPEESAQSQAPQTQFFNSTLRPEDFRDLLPPVDQGGKPHQTQEFDEEPYQEGQGGLLARFRRGRGDRVGDYFRGNRADGQPDEYDEHFEDEDDYYEERVWRMHPLVLIPVMFALAGVALWFPWFGFALGVLVIAGLAGLDVVKAEHARRLQTRGPRNTDKMVVALSFPWAFGRMLARTVGFGAIYLVGGILVGMVYAALVGDTEGQGANYTGGFAVFVMVLLGYIMPSGREARHQAVWLVERAKFRSLYVYIGVIVGVSLLAMLILSIGLSAAPDWAPFGGPSDWFS